MQKNQPSIHPILKTTLLSLDLDLEAELNRYNYGPNPNLESKSVVVGQSSLRASLSLPEANWQPQDSSEPIPVAVRVLPEEKPLLDNLLTPWGICSLIFFFLGNAFLFIHWGIPPQITNPPSQGTKITPEANSARPRENSLSALEAQTTSSDRAKAENQLKAEPNSRSDRSLPAPEPASNSQPGIEVHSARRTGAIVNEQVSPYQDLASAILSQTSSPKPKPTSASQPNYPPKLTPLLVKHQNSVPVINANSSPPPPPTITGTAQEENLADSSSPAPTNTEAGERELAYYVVADYVSPQSLQTVQTVVPDAFLTNIEEEIKIQLKVFATEVDAAKFVQQLQQQGIISHAIAAERQED